MKKNTNKILFIVLFVLLATFILTKVFRSPALESNLDTGLFGIDTAQIVSIRLERKDKPTLTLNKNDDVWTISEKGKSARVENIALDNLLRILSQLKPERIVSRKSEKWNTYQVDDTTSIHMTAFDRDSEELINWYVGKESQGITYIRPGDENEVYAIEGRLHNPLDKEFNAWRDKTLLRLEKANVSKVIFNYPDSNFVLEKKGSAWMIGNEKADSIKVGRYLSKLQTKDLADFADTFDTERPADLSMSIEGTSMTPVTIQAWKTPEGEWVLTSGFQDSVYFSSKSLPEDIFIGKKQVAGGEGG